MGKFKELSKSCKICGVEFLPDLSNKYPKRARCLECKSEENKQRTIEQREWREENVVSMVEKKSPYTFRNRKSFWREINKELKSKKRREDWLPLIQKRMDEILEDKQLMDYINDTQIAEYNKIKKQRI